MNLKDYRKLCKKWAKMRGLYDSYDKASWGFSRDSAIHWYCTYWHSGQFSELYRIIGQIGYNPSRLSRNAKDDLKEDYMAWELYKFLNRRAKYYSKNGSHWRV